MKNRVDFVTNSSSSSFIVNIAFNLRNGEKITFEGQGGTPEEGRRDYFDGNALIGVSPKELGEAYSIEELISLLQKGIVDDVYEDGLIEKGLPIFNESNPRMTQADESLYGYREEDDPEPDLYDAYDFIVEIKEGIHSMEDIKSISVSGSEYNFENYIQEYCYDMDSKSYKGVVTGEYLDGIEGAHGGEFMLGDLDLCNIEYKTQE